MVRDPLRLFDDGKGEGVLRASISPVLFRFSVPGKRGHCWRCNEWFPTSITELQRKKGRKETICYPRSGAR